MKRILFNLEDEVYDRFINEMAETPPHAHTIEDAILNGIVLPESDTASSNNKYAIIFESDEDLDGTTIAFGGLLGMDDVPEFVTVRKLPNKMPEILGHFDTYQNGYAKGNNDILDKLEGKWGTYDGSVANNNPSATDTH